MKPVHPGMTKEEIEEAEKMLREYFNLPEKRDLISFSHRGRTCEQYDYKRKIEKFIFANTSRLVETFERRPGPADIIKMGGRLFRLTERVYEVKNHGALIYYESDTIDAYFASVELFGFDKGSEWFRSLKSQLETLSREGESTQ